MMVIVPRIAVAPSIDAAPFVYGIRRTVDLRSGLKFLSPAESVRSSGAGAEWTETIRHTFAFAAWVVRKDADKAAATALQQALTYELGHTCESGLGGERGDKSCDIYDHLARDIDHIFDNQKHKALQKFWDSGIKVAPRANPG